MSEYLAGLLRDIVDLDEETERILIKGTRSLTREERKVLYGELRDTVRQVKAGVEELWLQGDVQFKDELLSQTAASIVDRGGDRDSLDRIAARLIGPLKVYNKVQQICDEKKVVLKATASQGGCTFILIALCIIIGLLVVLFKGQM
ncbi:MAG TPA: hypothetical protein VHS59_02695 [Bacillota bacterium]|nr:hypothetical protein [Bacillota bacterium]